MMIVSMMIVGSSATDMKCVGDSLTAGKKAGHRLYPGEFLCNGKIKFGLTYEGKVVCIKGDYYTKFSDPAKYMEMQPDGNLVAYSKKGAVFASDTHGYDGAALILADYRAIVYKGGYPGKNANLDPKKKLATYYCK